MCVRQRYCLIDTTGFRVPYHPPGISKEHLQRQLSDARVASAIDHCEGARVDVSARVDELSVIEDIKKFGPELDADALRDPVSYTHLTLPTICSV